MNDVFISYAREDRAKIERLATALEAQGWSVFWDRDIPSGQTWRSFVGKALEETRCIIVAWSRASVDSHWVQEEAEEARQRSLLVPVLLDNVVPPIGFRSVQAAELLDWDGAPTADAFLRFVDDLSRVLGPPPRLEGQAGRGPWGDPSPARVSRPGNAAANGSRATWVRPASAVALIGLVGVAAWEFWPRRDDPAHQDAPEITNLEPSGSPVTPGDELTGGTSEQSVPIASMPPPPLEPRITRFDADKTSIAAGDDVTLGWSTADAERVELRPGGPVALVGSTAVSPRQSMTYELVAFGPGGEARRSVSVAVAAAQPPTATLTADPPSVVLGTSTILTWRTTNASSVQISGLGEVPTSGSRSVTPTGAATYRLTAAGAGGTTARDVSVAIAPPHVLREMVSGAFPSGFSVMVPAIDIAGLRWTASNLNRQAPGSVCYGDQARSCEAEGRLYTWEQARSTCGSLGAGWRLARDGDWRALTRSYGGAYGDVSPDQGVSAYRALARNGTTGFGGSFGGKQQYFPDRDLYSFYDFGAIGYYWADQLDPNDSNNAIIYTFRSSDTRVLRETQTKLSFGSVRCVSG